MRGRTDPSGSGASIETHFEMFDVAKVQIDADVVNHRLIVYQANTIRRARGQRAKGKDLLFAEVCQASQILRCTEHWSAISYRVMLLAPLHSHVGRWQPTPLIS